MEKLKSLLTVPYKQENYKQFTADFLNDMEAVPLQEQADIPSMFKNTIQSYTIFGKYEDSVGKSVIVLSVKVKNNSSAPKAQRNFVAYLLENQFTDFNGSSNIEMGKKWYENIIFSFIYAIISMKVIY